jgi:DNA-binding MarR family transcriptional regulator
MKNSKAAKGARATGDVETILDDYLGFLIIGVGNRIAATATAFYQKHYNLTMAARRILLVGETAGLNATQIAKAADLDKTAASRGLKELHELGLVKVSKTKVGGKDIKVEYFPAGREVHRQIRAITAWRGARLFGHLTDSQKKQLRKLLSSALDAVEELDMSRYEAVYDWPDGKPWRKRAPKPKRE